MNEYQKALANISSDLHSGESTTTTGDMFLIQELVDKETPMKPIESKKDIYHKCPNCRSLEIQSYSFFRTLHRNERCSKCGQRIDWSDIE